MRDRQPLPMAEGELRLHMASQIAGLCAAAAQPLLKVFTHHTPSSWSALQHHLLDGLDHAEQWTSWNGQNKNNRIGIGFYTSPENFFTSMSHELGHDTLIKLGRTNTEYRNNPLEEEQFCWTFSQTICTTLNLPFSDTDMALSLRTAIATVELTMHNSPATASTLQKLFETEHELNGYCREMGDILKWTPQGIPQVVHPITHTSMYE